MSFLSPCVLPLVPPYLCFLGGTTFDQLTGEDETPSHVYATVVLSSFAFVLGFTTVFVILGATATFAGQLARRESSALLSKIAGVVIIVAGLHFLSVIHIPISASGGALSCRRASRRARRRLSDRARLRFRLDALHRAGACRDPRLWPPARTRCAKVSCSCFVYSLGLGIPFIAAAFAVRPFLNALQRFRPHLATMEKVLGGFLVLTGILFLTNSMTLISGWMLELFPGLAKIG